MRGRSALAGLLLASCVSVSPAPATAPPSSPPSALPAPTASPTPARSTSIRTTAVPAIPAEFTYVGSSPGRDVTLWLVDLSGATAPVAVARWTYGNDSSAVSGDGKTVIVAAAGEHSIFGLHLVRPLTGEATILFEGPPDGRVFFPRLSADGRSYAFTLQRSSGSDGIFAGTIGGGPPRQVVAAPSPGSPPQPYGWSDDGQWLVYYSAGVSAAQSCCTYLRNMTDGRLIDLRTVAAPSWRAREPRIVAASLGGRGNQGAFGADVFTFDVTAQRRTGLFSLEPRVNSLAWHPTRDELLYVEDATGCHYRGTVWTRAVSGDARRVGTLDTVERAWWSFDGSTIYALARGEGQDAAVVDATTGRRIATIPNDVRTLPGCS